MTTHEDARRLMPFQDGRNRIERARYLAGVFQAAQDNRAAILRDFIRTLRGALDSAIVDIAHVRAKDPEGVTFPIADNARQLDHLCEVDFRRIDEDLADYLQKLRPWRGGHPYLHLLRDLDDDAACREFVAANGEVFPQMERIFQAAAETLAELGSRFWARP